MKSYQNELFAMEGIISKLRSGVNREELLDSARQHLSNAIQLVCEISAESVGNSMSELIDAASKSNKGRRESAIFVLRAISIDGVLPIETEPTLALKIVMLVEENFGEKIRNPKISEKKQTFEKINLIRGYHDVIIKNLTPLSSISPTLSEIVGARNDIFKVIKSTQCGAYLQPYDWQNLKVKITQLLDLASELYSCKDSSYKAQFDNLAELCNNILEISVNNKSFLHHEAITPFAASLKLALSEIEQEAKDNFNCVLEARRRPPNLAEKRYPLHQVDKIITVTIPFINNGPGVAIDVEVELDSGPTSGIVLDSENILVGDIPPGEFAISFKAMIVNPASEANLVMQLSWKQLFSENRCTAINIKLIAQDHTVDWSLLEQLDPYSLEVAEGDRFVGRAVKVQTVGNRILKAQMSSTYITGQKRVGKTSLAQAVLRYIKSNAKTPTSYETFYLEWGEYCTSDAKTTMQGLGQHLYDFLVSYLPPQINRPGGDFSSSLAPLNLVSKLLESALPDKRFVIVLDEFDELHPEMYRFGPLAEAFFANLRTLGARKNLAFILVGGEKMPFIIGAQGDQLNKFGREPVDYFSRSDEWNDYVELVTGPVKESLNWEESALNELFTITNGHPYYTKLLCSKIFSNAVAQRDTDIVKSDVRHAFNGRVAEMDTNAFAHFWKDGIDAERELAEVLELRRLRVLVAFGRSLRVGPATKDSILSNMSLGIRQAFEVGPVVDDFCRRDIMHEVGKNVDVTLPIFGRWVKEIGVSKLISSTLADDIENELEKLNDAAFVNSGEILAAIKDWPLYRGRAIGPESVRAWLDQLDNPLEERIIFKLLQNLRFISTSEINEKLRQAHERVLRATPPVIKESKLEKRRDLLVTYLDGPGKSGSTYARSYAKENGLLMDSVVEPSRVLRKIENEANIVNGVVVVDDLSGTGRTISEGIINLLVDIGGKLAKNKIPLFVVILFATEEAEEKIGNSIKEFTENIINLNVSELITHENSAFQKEGFGFWNDQNEHDRAKALCVRLGTGLYKEPLGFGGQSLLIAFPDTCPNNSLPIIFASRAGGKSWTALLQRPAS